MTLKAVLTTDEYEALDESAQALYKEKQGKDGWILDLEGVDDHPTVKGLKSTLMKFKEIAPDASSLKALKINYEALKETWEGLDADEVREQLTRLETLETGDGKVDVQAQIDAVKLSLEKKHAKEVEALKTQLGERDTQLSENLSFTENLIVERELDEGLDHIKAIPELRAGAKALIRTRFTPKVERVENERTGKPEYRGIIKTDVGESSIADFFERWATEDEALPYLPSSGNQGTQSRSSDGISGPRKTNPWVPETRNITEQGRIVRENPGLAKQMAAAAGVKLSIS